MNMTLSIAYPYRRLVLLLAAVTATMTAVHADTSQAPQIPTCDKKLGTLAVNEPQDPWWTAMQLDSPAAADLRKVPR